MRSLLSTAAVIALLASPALAGNLSGALGNATSGVGGAVGGTTSAVGGALGNATLGVGGAVGGTTSAVGGALGSATSGVSGAVGGTTSAVGGALGGGAPSATGVNGQAGFGGEFTSEEGPESSLTKYPYYRKWIIKKRKKVFRHKGMEKWEGDYGLPPEQLQFVCDQGMRRSTGQPALPRRRNSDPPRVQRSTCCSGVGLAFQCNPDLRRGPTRVERLGERSVRKRPARRLPSGYDAGLLLRDPP